jgi:hypothetical protein
MRVKTDAWGKPKLFLVLKLFEGVCIHLHLEQGTMLSDYEHTQDEVYLSMTYITHLVPPDVTDDDTICDVVRSKFWRTSVTSHKGGSEICLSAQKLIWFLCSDQTHAVCSVSTARADGPFLMYSSIYSLGNFVLNHVRGRPG